MMKQFLFEQLSNSVQNTTSKLVAHSEDNKKIISILDNLINSLNNSNQPPSQQLIEQDVEKISEFVSEILGSLDSCLFTLEYNTNKYVQHLFKNKDTVQENQISNNNTDLYQIQNNVQQPNVNQMQGYNNTYINQQDYDQMEEDYSQDQHYQQLNNGFNGMDDDDEEEDQEIDNYDEGEDIYLGEDEQEEELDDQHQIVQNQKQNYIQKQQPYYYNQQLQNTPYNQQQNHQNEQKLPANYKNSDSYHLIQPQQLQQYTQSQRVSNFTIIPSKKIQQRNNNLTVNDIFQ